MTRFEKKTSLFFKKNNVPPSKVQKFYISPSHCLFKLIVVDTHSYNIHIIIVELIPSFFQWTIIEWNKVDLKCCKYTYNVFRNHLLESAWPLSNPIYNIYDSLGTHLISRLRLGLSHLNEHRLNHNFDNCINPLCIWILEVESTRHFTTLSFLQQYL